MTAIVAKSAKNSLCHSCPRLLDVDMQSVFSFLIFIPGFILLIKKKWVDKGKQTQGNPRWNRLQAGDVLKCLG